MGWDVWAKIDTGGTAPAMVSGSYNYTYNTNPMLKEVGIDWEALHGKPISQVIAVLESGVSMLKARPEHFRAMNPANKRGCYDTLLRKLEEILEDFRQHPKATLGTWL